jgi:hypothetical protein
MMMMMMMMMVDSDLLLALAVSVPCLHLRLCSVFLKDKRVAKSCKLGA